VSREFKDRLYGEFAVLGKALANAHRLELLDILGQAERNVDELAREAGLGLTTASAHLQVLRRARLVEADKRGLNVVYRLASPQVFEMWRTLRELGSTRLAEVERLVQSYFADRSSLEAIGLAELRDRLADDDVVIIDVRPAIEYRQGHIIGALSAPVEDLSRQIADLPLGREVVAYCRGPYCVLADEAVRTLRRHGFRVRRLVAGFPEWRAAGYPIAVAA
jgi:rhodanese-related sulfurtransferase